MITNVPGKNILETNISSRRSSMETNCTQKVINLALSLLSDCSLLRETEFPVDEYLLGLPRT